MRIVDPECSDALADPEQENFEHFLPQPGAARTLDGFAEDPGNQLALAACRRIVREPGLAHNPLYLHGPGGTGKSYLLAAVAAEFGAAAGEEGAALFTGDEFVATWAQALAGREAHPLKELVEGSVLIACDGIDALSGRQLAQEQFFLMVNSALDRGQQVLVAGRVPPHRLPDVEERLATRLGWGLTVALESPLLETRIAVLKRLSPVAAEIDPGELAGLVETWGGDMHAIADLAARIELGERPDAAGAEIASFDRILQAVASRYGVRPGDITGAGRARQIARARQAALLLGRRLTGHSLVALGGMVGGRDHSTVLYGIGQAEQRLAEDPDFAKDIAEITREVRGERR
ncbi:MAG: AAA family ATPase [Planctomycetes bacterium]|nr:AAA family ATPase [Planctomycetota bacterium]